MNHLNFDFKNLSNRLSEINNDFIIRKRRSIKIWVYFGFLRLNWHTSSVPRSLMFYVGMSLYHSVLSWTRSWLPTNEITHNWKFQQWLDSGKIGSFNIIQNQSWNMNYQCWHNQTKTLFQQAMNESRISDNSHVFVSFWTVNSHVHWLLFSTIISEKSEEKRNEQY